MFVDRGKGFYHPGTAAITPEFKAALKTCKFKAFWGGDASAQPGHLQELMLHETAVSWLRVRLDRGALKTQRIVLNQIKATNRPGLTQTGAIAALILSCYVGSHVSEENVDVWSPFLSRLAPLLFYATPLPS